MKIYFAGSIRGGRDGAEVYAKIIDYLKSYGEVLTEHVGDANLCEVEERDLTEIEIHDRDLGWLLDSDVIVAEVSTPSLGVGYEIGTAVRAGKKVLCLYRPTEGKKLSVMIMGSSDVENKEYETFEDAKRIIDEFFGKLT